MRPGRAWFGPQARLETLELSERHASALHFLRALKASGADAAEGSVLTAGVMRRAMAGFAARGCVATYRVLLAVEQID